MNQSDRRATEYYTALKYANSIGFCFTSKQKIMRNFSKRTSTTIRTHRFRKASDKPILNRLFCEQQRKRQSILHLQSSLKLSKELQFAADFKREPHIIIFAPRYWSRWLVGRRRQKMQT